MIIQFSQQDFAPRSFVASNSPENTAEQNCDGGRLEIPENIAGGRVAADAVSPGLSLICSEMSFAKDTFFREEYQDRDVLQIAFCLQGNCEWSYGNGARPHQLAPAECSLQCGVMRKCDSFFPRGPYRALSLSLGRERFADVIECLKDVRLLDSGDMIRTRVFAGTPHLRLLIRQLTECPPDYKLRKLFLEGKALELLSVFCSEVIGRKEKKGDVSREDRRCLRQARERIDEQFLLPLTISQIAKECHMSETKLKRGFKNCFGCTVYEYMVEKRMELAHSLLSSGKYKVKDVVWMAGYSNAGHFIKMFRKRYGLTPGEIS
ncbi:Regulatory protein PchR [bioreactor metagenome]|uniref:Regulatory protein PchR n=2 Tax=root TaxID=1 RepID=A0A645CLA1_9ZZZZ|nr:AraC family transcriptional regulator [Cloacibacillus evryensis]EXG78201.1 DNA-binding domain-containing protein, AraC-type [Cloacibacillus evryensis DSM 19522]MEA5035873.1 AraC family transcriptional regulator [Cloacibacillus evryensis]